jgi:hypothetical protein
MSFMDELSLRLGIPYRFAPLPEGCKALLLDGTAVINRDLTPEQAHWSFCHEAAHLQLGHAKHLPRDESEEREQEREANLLASELLLPTAQFRPHANESLSALKRAFPHASYEALARRRLLFRSGLLTICDNGKVTARLAPDGWNPPRALFPLEAEAIRTCYREQTEIHLRRDEMQVEATYVDQGRGVLRVISFMEGGF